MGKSFEFKECERFLKRALKDKGMYSKGAVIAFLITGGIGFVAPVLLGDSVYAATYKYVKVQTDTGRTFGEGEQDGETNSVILAPTSGANSGALAVSDTYTIYPGNFNRKARNSVILGYGAYANGLSTETTPSSFTAIGALSHAYGGQGTAVGSGTIAGIQATAIGNDVYATGDSSIAIGNDDIATKYRDRLSLETMKSVYGEGPGKGLFESKEFQSSEGSFKKQLSVLDWNRFYGSYLTDDKLIYNPTISRGVGSIAIGSRSIAAKDGATAIGTLAYAFAEGSTAMGLRAFTAKEAIGAVAIGEQSRSFAQGSLAVGNRNESTSLGSMSYGYNAKAVGEGSLAFGYNVLANAAITNTIAGVGDTKPPTNVYRKALMDNTQGFNYEQLKYIRLYDASLKEYAEILNKPITDTYTEADKKRDVEHYRLNVVDSKAEYDKVIKAFTNSGANAAGKNGRNLEDVNNLDLVNKADTTDKSGNTVTAVGVAINDIIGKTTNTTDNTLNVSLAEDTKAGKYLTTTDRKADGTLVTKEIYKLKANGKNAIAIGYYTAASGDSSIAQGAGSIVEGSSGIGIGSLSYVSGDAKNGIAMGVGSQVRNANSIAIGTQAAVYGAKGIGMGPGARVIGDESMALGYGSFVKTKASTALGVGTTIEYGANESMALGTKAYVGTGNIATLSVGNNARVEENSVNSASIGASSKIGKQSSNSVVLGISSTIGDLAANSVVLGSHASISDNSSNSMALGAGAKITDSAKSSIALGEGSLVSKSSSLAFGRNSSVTGDSSIAIGRNATTSTESSVALGRGAAADFKNSVALGYRSTTFYYGDAATRQAGTSTTVSGTYKHGLDIEPYLPDSAGKGIKEKLAHLNTAAAGYISVGGWDVTKNEDGTANPSGADATLRGLRRIVNVAPGALDTDAVTVAQLREWTDKSAHFLSLAGAENKSATDFADETAPDGTTTVHSNFDNNGATGEHALALGVYAMGKGAGSVSIGRSSFGQGDNSTTLGSYGWGRGTEATSIGYRAYSYGTQSVALGTRTVTDSDYGVAIGNRARSWSEGSNGHSGIAIGSKATANYWNALAMGTESKVRGWHSTAIGAGAQVGMPEVFNDDGVSMNVFKADGKSYNKANQVVYEKTGETNTEYTVKEYRPGTTTVVKTFTIQKPSTIHNAMALGHEASVTNDRVTDAKDATRVNEFSSAGSIAIGASASVKGSQNSVALGLNSKVVRTDTETKSISAFTGDKNNDPGNGVVSLGNSDGVTRRIIHVAGGQDDYDAVNVKQLKAAVKYYKTNATDTNDRTVNSIADVSANYNGEGATGTASVTLGSYTKASGNYSTAIGRDVITTGTTAVGIGTNVSAFGNSSVALGNNAIAGYTKTENSKTVPVGATEGVAIGNASAVESSYAIAIGGNAKVLRDTTDAIDATGAIDATKIKDSESSVAIGAGAKVIGAKYSVALGLNSRVNAADTATKTTAAFSGEVNDDPGFGVVSVGQSGKYRRILNVAGGVNDNDAVNVKQLKAAAWGLQVENGTAATDVTPDTTNHKIKLKAGNNVTLDNTNGVVTINASGGLNSITSDNSDVLGVSTNAGAVTLTPKVATTITGTGTDANKLVTSSVVNTALNAKANASDLAAKVDKTAELHVRAGDYTVANNGEVSLIQEDADGTQNSGKGFKIKGIATKGDITNINTTLAGKADKSYVDTQIGTVSNLGYKANGGTAKQVAVGTGLNFVQGDGTANTAASAKAGIEIVAGDDGKVTFGLNEATRNTIDNAASTAYVDTKFGNAANKNLDNLNDAGLNKVKDLAAGAVKVAAGKNVNVKGVTTNHVTTYTVDAIDTTVAAGDGLSVSDGDTVDTTTNKRNYTVGLSADTKAKLAKVDTLANTVGTIGADGRDGKAGTGKEAADATAVAGDKGLTGKDGLNGKDLTSKVNALRNGEAGTVVYTDENGNRLAKANDGQYYPANKVNADGTKAADAVAVATPQARLVNPTGSTTTATKLSNIAAGEIKAGSTDAINGDQLHTELAKKADVTALNGKVDKAAEFHVKADTYKVGDDGVVTVKQEDGTGAEATGKEFKISGLATKTDITNINTTLNNKANASDLEGLKTNPITFTGDDAQAVTRVLGTTLTVKGAANFTPADTNPATAAGVNIRVEKDPTANANGLVVKLADTLTNMKGISGTGKNDLVIKNGDNAVITVKPGADGAKGDVDFGGSKLTNIGTPGANTDAANKAYVDTKFGNAANKDLDNLNDAGLNKVKDLAATAVKVAPGKNVVVTPKTTDHVTTYTVDAIDTTVAAGDGLSVSDGDTVDTTTNKRNYTVGLSADTKAKLAKIDTLANTVGTIGADGRDGKAGTGKEAADATAVAGDKGLTGKDGLNGKDLTNKVNALRNGEAGTVVYTDDQGNRLVKANDGNYYPAGKVNADGTKADDAVAVTNPQARLVNADGSTTTATGKTGTVLSNIANGKVADTSTDAVTGGQLHTAKSELAKALGGNASVDANGALTGPTYSITKDDATGGTDTVNNVGAAVSKLDTRINTVKEMAAKPLTFTGDDKKDVTRALGTTLTVKGAENFTPATDATAGVNIRVEKDLTTNANGLVVKLADTLTNMKGISGNGKDLVVIKNGDQSITITPTTAAETGPDGAVIKPAQVGKIDFGTSKLTSSATPTEKNDLVTKGYLEKAIEDVNNVATGNASLGYKANAETAKSVNVNTGLHFKSGTGTINATGTDATTTNAATTKTGIAITTEENGVVNIGLDANTRTAIDKVATLETAIGNSGADGRDGKPGTGTNAGSGKDGLTAEDGLNGKDLTSKVNALRNGEAGSVVYTDAEGNRVVKAEDGKWYNAKAVDEKGKLKPADQLPQGVTRDEVTNPQARLVNADGTTTGGTTVFNNVASAIPAAAADGAKPTFLDNLNTAANNDTTKHAAVNVGDLNSTAKDIIAKGLTFQGNDGQDIKKQLGETLHIVGEGTLATTTTTAANNIRTKKNDDGKLEIGLAKDLVGITSITNGDTTITVKPSKPKDGDKPAEPSTVDFGGAKLSNIGDANADTDATNKKYVDDKVAGLNLGYKAETEAAKSVAVTTGLTFKAGTGTIAPTNLAPTAESPTKTTDTVATKKGIVISTEENGVVNIGLDEATRKVIDNAAKIGDTAVDGRDGKPANGKTGTAGNAGDHGLTGADGLNGKDLTNKVNALRNGEAGTVVYTDENGNRLVKANDGNYYPAGKVNADGTKADDAVAVTNPQARLVNPDGTTTTAAGVTGTVLSNIANGKIADKSTDAVTGGQLYTAKSELATALGGNAGVDTNGALTNPSYSITKDDAAGGTDTVNNVGAAVTKLDARINTLKNSELTFTGDSGSVIRKLGETLTVKGAKNFIPATDATAGVNIRVEKDPTADANGLVVKLADTLTGMKGISGDGQNDLVIKNGTNTITVTPNTAEVKNDAGEVTKKADPGTVNFGGAKLITSSTATEGTDVTNKNYVDDAISKVNNAVAGNATLNFAGNVTKDEHNADTTKVGLSLSTGVLKVQGDTVAKDIVTTAKGDTIIIGLHQDVKDQLAKLGNTAADGRDGKSGTGANAGIGKEGLTGADGLNGTDLTTKVNALRNGEAGSVVYTDAEGNRVVKAEDGKWYNAKAVDEHGKLKPADQLPQGVTRAEVTNPQARLVNPNGTTTGGTTVFNNVASAIPAAAADGAKPTFLDNLNTAAGDAKTKHAAVNVSDLNSTATEIIAKGLTFQGNDGQGIKKQLGETLDIVGEGTLATTTTTAANNIRTKKNDDGKLEIGLAKDLVGITSITNGDTTITVKPSKPKDGDKPAEPSTVDFGGAKLSNIGDANADTDATNKKYVDEKVAGLNLGYKAETETAKSVAVKTGLTFKAGTGTIAPANLAPTTESPTKATDTVTTKKGIVISTEENGVVNIGLDEATRKVIDNAAKIGDTAVDGRDGKPGTGATAGMGKDGVTGQDGLNGTDLTTKVNALRNGEAGTVVYTDADGNRLVRATDGKFYKATEVKPDGTVKAVGEDGITKEPVGLEADKVIASLVSPNGATAPKADDATKKAMTKLSNIAEGTISDKSNDAVTGRQLYAAKKEVGDIIGGTTIDTNGKITGPTFTITKADGTNETTSTIKGAIEKLNTTNVDQNDKISSLTSAVDKSITFVGDHDTNDKITRKLGDTLNIKGQNNITVTKATGTDDTLNVSLSSTLKNITSISSGEGTTKPGSTITLGADGVTFTNVQPGTDTTAGATSTVKINKDGIDAGTMRITNVAKATANGDAANKEYVDEAISKVNNAVAGNATLNFAGNVTKDEHDADVAKVGLPLSTGVLKVQGNADTKDIVTTAKGDTIIIGLHKDVKDQLAKLGNTAADGRDGKPGTGNNPGMGHDGVTGQDGLNGTDLTTKVNALRNGEAGTVVYTDADGNRLVRATDGKFYKATEVKPDGTVKTVGEDGITKEPVGLEADKVIASLVSPNGATAPTADDADKKAMTKLSNIAEGTISDKSNDAVTGRQLHAAKQELATALGGNAAVNTDGTLKAPTYSITKDDAAGGTDTVNNVGAAVTKLDERITAARAYTDTKVGAVKTELTTSGLDFKGDDTGVVHRNLGTELTIKGGANFTPVAAPETTTAGTTTTATADSVNIRVEKDPTTNANGLVVKLADTLTGMKGISGNGTDPLVIKNGDTTITVKPSKPKDGDKPAEPSTVDFGGAKLTNIGDANADTDATNKKYVDDKVAGLNLGYKAETETAKSVAVTTGLTFKAGTGTIAPTNLAPTAESPTKTTDTVTTKKGIVISTESDGVVNIGLDEATRKVIDNAAKIGDTAVDGRDGKPANGKTGAAGNAGDHGLTGADGLNGKDLTNKVNALRNGEAGTVVYTDDQGNRLVKANDGNYYPAGKVNADGTKADDAVAVTNPQARLVNPDGTTTTAAGVTGTVLSNIANGKIADKSTDAVTGGQLYTAKSELATALGGNAAVNTDGTLKAPTYSITKDDAAGGTDTVDNVGAAVTKLDSRINTLKNSQLTFQGNDQQGIKKQLGETLHIVGEGTLATTTTAANNIRTKKNDDGKLEIGLAKDLVGITSITNETDATKPSTKVEIGNDGITVTNTQPADATAGTAATTSKVMVGKDGVKVGDKVTINTSGMSGNGTDPLTITNGDTTITVKPSKPKDGDKPAEPSSVDFGGAKLTNVGEAKDGTDAVNKAYVDSKIGGVAEIGYKADTETDTKKVAVSTGLTFKSGTGTIAPANLAPTTESPTKDTDTVKTKKGIVISTEENGVVNIGLDEATRKVIDNAAKIGDTAVDGRDGKPANGKTGTAGNAGDHGLTGADGLNGKDLTNKVNALRNGEAGTVVYTDDQGNRLVKANDGNYYPAGKVNADGTKADDAVAVTNPQARLVNPDGTTTTAAGVTGTVLSNIANGKIADKSTDAVTGGQLYTAKSELATALGGNAGVDANGALTQPTYSITKDDATGTDTVNNVGAAVTKLDSRINTLKNSQLTFTGDSGSVTRKLGETLTVKGAENFTPAADATAGVNIRVEKDPTADANGLVVKLADTLTGMKGVSGDGTDPLTIKNGDTTITVKPSKPKDGDKPAEPSTVDFGGAKLSNIGDANADTDATNKKYVDDKVAGLNLGYKAETEAAKSVSVTTGLTFKAGTGTIAPTNLAPTAESPTKTTDTVTTKKGIVISTESDGVVNIGLDEATRKVIDNAAKIGDTAVDGRDGKPANGKTGTAGNAGDHGLTGADGLNGKDLTNKVNALRNGEAGTVVYTDDQGNRLVKANDGNYYPAGKVNADGTKADDAVAVTNPQARLVNTDGTTTGGTTVFNNVASPIANTVVKDAQDQPIANAPFLDRLKKTAADAQLQHAAVNVSDLNSTATEIIAKGLTFQGNDGSDIKKQLGETLHIVGEGTVATTTTTAANNIRTKKNDDGKLEIGLAKDLVGITSITNETDATKPSTKVEIGNDGITVTNTQPADATAGTAATTSKVMVGKDGVKVGDKVTINTSGMSGNGTDPLTITNGANTTITVKPSTATDTKGTVDFGGAKLTNVGEAKADTDATNKAYVDSKVGAVAKLGYKANTETETKKVGVADGLHFKSGTGTIDATGTGADVTNAATTKTGIAISTEDNGVVNIGLDEATRKVIDQAAKLGDTSIDGRDGKPGTGNNPGMGKDGVTGADGLNGTDLTTKVNALRNGEAGSVVYTDADGNRLVRATDGKFYKASEVKPDGTVKAVGEDGITKAPVGLEADKVIASLVSPDGATAPKADDADKKAMTKLSNIAEGAITATSNDAVTGRQLHAERKALATVLGGNAGVADDGTWTKPTYTITNDGGATPHTVDNVGSAVTKLDERITDARTYTDTKVSAANTAGMNFVGDDTASVHRNLGDTLTVKGANNFTPAADATAGVNIRVEKDPTTNANGLVVKLADTLTNMKGISGDGEHDLVIKNGTNTITMTAGTAEVKNDAGVVTKKADPGTVNFGDAIVTVKNLDASITYRANGATGTDIRTVKLKDGFNFVAGTGTIAATGATSATTNAETTKKGITITTGENGAVTIGLDAETRKTIDNAGKIGNTASDGRDGKTADGTGGAAGDKGLTGKDGLNGADLTTKVNALRNGEAGTVVYTDETGSRLVKANDGKYYKANEVDKDGNVITPTDGTTPTAATTVEARLVNPDGTTTTATVFNNVASSIEHVKVTDKDNKEIAKPTFLERLTTAATTSSKLGVVNVKDLHDASKDIIDLGLDFYGNDETEATGKVHRNLGTAVKIQGAGTFTREADKTNNINVKRNTAQDGFTVELAENLTGMKEVAGNDTDALVLRNGKDTATNTKVAVDTNKFTVTASTSTPATTAGEAAKVTTGTIEMNAEGTTTFTNSEAPTNAVTINSKSGAITTGHTTVNGSSVSVVDGNSSVVTTASGTTITKGSVTTTATAGKTEYKDGDHVTTVSTEGMTATDGTDVAMYTAGGSTFTDANSTATHTAAGTTFVAGDHTANHTALTSTYSDGTNTVAVGSAGITITPSAAGDVVSLTNTGLNNGGNVITNVAAGTADTDAVNVKQLKAGKTTFSVNDKDSATTNHNLVLTTTTDATDGHTHHDVKLADTVTLGKDGNAVTVDGTNGSIIAGKDDNAVTVDGANGKITTGHTEVTGSAVTIKDAANDAKKTTVDATGTTVTDGTTTTTATAGSTIYKNGTNETTVNTTNVIVKDGTATTTTKAGETKYDANGKNLTVNTDGITVKDGNNIGSINAMNSTFTNATNGTQVGPTLIRVNGENKNNAIEGGISIGYHADVVTSAATATKETGNFITGLVNTTWNPKANGIVSGRAATEDQLKAVDDKVNKGRVFTADTKVGDKPLEAMVGLGDTLSIKGGADMTALTDNNIGVELKDAETKDGKVVTPATMTVKLAKDVKMGDGSTSYVSNLPEYERDEHGNVIYYKDKFGTVLPKEKVDEKGHTIYRTDKDNNPITLRTAKVDGDSTTHILYKTENGNIVVNKDGKPVIDVITGVGANGIAITSNGKPSVTLTSKGLDNGGNTISNIAPGVYESDAATVGQLNTVSNTVTTKVNEAGAHAAALAAMNPLSYDPLKKSQVMAGVGAYKGNKALALGVAHYANEDTMFNVGVSVGGGSNMMNAGVTYRFGGEDSMIPERYKGGPISSVYILQDEVSALKAENAQVKADNEQVKADNARMKENYEKVMQDNEEMKAQIKMLMAHMGIK